MYRYFLYSEEQFKEQNSILKNTGKQFVAGTVIVNGARKKYTQLSSTPTIERYIDATIVTEGELSEITYIAPKKTKIN
jgi:hypothetical protein